jgi:hypothetical protein
VLPTALADGVSGGPVPTRLLTGTGAGSPRSKRRAPDRRPERARLCFSRSLNHLDRDPARHLPSIPAWHLVCPYSPRTTRSSEPSGKGNREGKAMPGSVGRRGTVQTTGTMRNAGGTVSPKALRLADRVLVVGELILCQVVGVPGTRACCEYLAGWWSSRTRHSTNRHSTANTTSEVVPASTTAAHDRERS